MQYRQAFLWTLFISTTMTHAGYGDAVNGIPNLQERESFAVTNMVRTSPQQFRDRYLGIDTILKEANHPAQSPFYWHSKLGISARSHSTDMAMNNCFQHNSCDGTTFEVRIKAMNPEQSGYGENIAMSYRSGFLAVKAWLIDADASRNPSPDLSSGAGHRTNIMRSSFKAIGTGYASNPSSTRSFLWTQDFGNRTELTYPIASGAHFSNTADSITFIATWYSATGEAPQSTSIILNGNSRALSLAMGTPSRGTYALTIAKPASGCFDYNFAFTNTAGQSIKYPETDILSTSPGSTCSGSTPILQGLRPLPSQGNSHQDSPKFNLLGRKAP